jgi:hypothetical protein
MITRVWNWTPTHTSYWITVATNSTTSPLCSRAFSRYARIPPYKVTNFNSKDLLLKWLELNSQAYYLLYRLASQMVKIWTKKVSLCLLCLWKFRRNIAAVNSSHLGLVSMMHCKLTHIFTCCLSSFCFPIFSTFHSWVVTPCCAGLDFLTFGEAGSFCHQVKALNSSLAQISYSSGPATNYSPWFKNGDSQDIQNGSNPGHYGIMQEWI